MKLTKHAWIIWGISLAVVLVLIAMIPFVRTISWWIGAACTVAMFILCACTFRMAFRKGDGLESKLLGWPIFKVGCVALIIQLVLGAIIMGTAAFLPTWMAAIAEVLVFAATGICLTVKDASRTVVTTSETMVADQTAPWKAIRAKANALAASGNADMKKLAEDIRYADPMPTEIDAQIAALLDGEVNPETIEQIKRLLNQRKSMKR